MKFSAQELQSWLHLSEASPTKIQGISIELAVSLVCCLSSFDDKCDNYVIFVVGLSSGKILRACVGSCTIPLWGSRWV